MVDTFVDRTGTEVTAGDTVAYATACYGRYPKLKFGVVQWVVRDKRADIWVGIIADGAVRPGRVHWTRVVKVRDFSAGE